MEKELARKFRLKKEMKIYFSNIPDILLPRFTKTDFAVNSTKKICSSLDGAIFFFMNKKEVDSILPPALPFFKNDPLLWLCYPKKSSNIKSDLSMNDSWNILTKFNFSPVSLISIDSTWSSFRVRKKEFVTSKRGKEPTSEEKKYILQNSREVLLPEDLKNSLIEKDLLKKFESFSFTHKKEFVLSVLEAKKEETRKRRIQKIIETILSK